MLAAIALIGSVALGHAADDAGAPLGRWMTTNQQAVIQIAPCGRDLCGQIVGLAQPSPPPLDWQGNTECGLTIIDATPTQDPDTGAVTYRGTVLDPRDGTTYNATISLNANHQLRLHGYVGLPIFGQTQTWNAYAGPTLAGCRLR
jgi:uncharacterized protein (DUF2147 family)